VGDARAFVHGWINHNSAASRTQASGRLTVPATDRGESTVPKKPARRPKKTVAGILGVGLDGEDGHKRITRTDEMVLVGGSAETHERMQETAIRFSEGLEKRGKTLKDASMKEVADLLRAAHDKTG
jgi:hypothetical protein